MGKPEQQRPLATPRSRWEDNIKMDFQEIAGGVDWLYLAQDRHKSCALVNRVMNLLLP
jgi:hypothetical protein